MSKIRAKFEVRSKQSYEGGEGGEVNLEPVFSDDPTHENKQFWDATPNGSIYMGIANPAAFGAFEEGAEYYVDFERAE